jgi:glycosyltransferase involved in cell wall biosynthesis
MRGVALVFEDDTGLRNEGRLNTAWNLAAALLEKGGLATSVPSLGKQHGSWRGFGARSLAAARTARRLRRSSPSPLQLIYLPDSSLTLGGTIRGVLYRIVTGSRRLIIVASQRRAASAAVLLALKLARTNVVTFDSVYARQLSARGVRSRHTTLGIDRSVFYRRTKPEKERAARTLGLVEPQNCVLHVGHLNERRGLAVLGQIAMRCSARVFLVAGSASPADEELARRLADAGVTVIREDFSNMREVYCAADVYVFPTSDSTGAIGFPLSVLEALAVGVPVVSTPFNDLPRAFPEGTGVVYAQTADEFCDRVTELLPPHPPMAVDARSLRGWDDVLEDVLSG